MLIWIPQVPAGAYSKTLHRKAARRTLRHPNSSKYLTFIFRTKYNNNNYNNTRIPTPSNNNNSSSNSTLSKLNKCFKPNLKCWNASWVRLRESSNKTAPPQLFPGAVTITEGRTAGSPRSTGATQSTATCLRPSTYPSRRCSRGWVKISSRWFRLSGSFMGTRIIKAMIHTGRALKIVLKAVHPNRMNNKS